MNQPSKFVLCAAATAVLALSLPSCEKGNATNDGTGIGDQGEAAKPYPSISDMLETDGPTVRVGPIGDAGEIIPEPPPTWTQGESPFGSACQTDSDCSDGLTCLTEGSDDWLGGGAPNGYCTLNCEADPQVCSTYDPLGICLVASDSGNSYCFEGCFQGETFEGETKCHDREDTVCAAFGFSAACVPSCGTDATCGETGACDIRRGVCTDEARAGLPMGARCDPDYNPCAALCLDFGFDVHLCSGFCSVGLPGQCGQDLGSTPAGGDALCIPLSSQGSQGDGGICLQGCNCDSDCYGNDTACEPFTEPGQAEQYGTNGLCYPREFLDIPAADAGGDAATVGTPCSVGPTSSDAGE